MEPRHDDPPWSISIREPSDDVPRRATNGVDRLGISPVAIVAVVAFVCVVAVAVLIGNDPDEAAPSSAVLGEHVAASGSSATPDDTVSDDTVSNDTVSNDTTTTVAPTTSTTSAPVATVADRQPGAADDSPEPARDGEPEGLPILGPDRVSGGWVAQLSSVPSAAGGNALTVAYETVTATVPDAIILRGSEWAPLRDGFFVIVDTGHDSASDAVEECDASGRTGRDECFARFLSSIDDTQRTCWRDEEGALAGDCG